MINLSGPFLLLCLAFVVSNCQHQQLLPFGAFQHDISFPSMAGELHTSTASNHQQPSIIRQVSTGFHLNPPPPLPFLQSFPINPLLFSTARTAWRSPSTQNGKFFAPPPLFNLFTPNTVSQKPESSAQEEEYRKYLKEEAEEAEKEKNENDITTDFANFDADVTSLGPNSKTFVRLNVQGKDYSYST